MQDRDIPERQRPIVGGLSFAILREMPMADLPSDPSGRATNRVIPLLLAIAALLASTLAWSGISLRELLAKLLS